MFRKKIRGFRHRQNERSDFSRGNGNIQAGLRPNSFLNEQTRNRFRPPPLSAEKLFEKYSALAKEAMSSGDRTLSENYLQHADHFIRVIEDKNRNQSQRKPSIIHKPAGDDKHLSQNSDINQDHPINNDRVTDNKE